MKTSYVALLGLLLAGLSASAAAQHYRDEYGGRRGRYDYAQVVDARPVYERVAGGECWDEPVAAPPPRPAGKPEIVGGVIGGVVSDGAATPAQSVAAAELNAALAEQREQRARALEPGSEVRYERHCEDGAEAERTALVGFDVTYDYYGDIGHTFSADEPGDEVRVRVR